MMKNKNKKWFVVQIKPNSYDLANRNLERQGFETFIPKMNMTNRINNKFVTKQIYVFPNYIFVSFNLKLTNWHLINNTYGVSKILSFNNRPAHICCSLIFELKNRYNSKIDIFESEKLYKGDIIKMHSGPFADFFGKVENVEKRNRIWVLLEYAGNTKRLNLQNIDNNKYRRI